MISSISILLGNISMWFFLPIVLVKCKPEFATFKYHFKETIIYFIPTIATTIYTVLDKTLIGLITENNDYNGQYESATKIINICKTIGFISIVGVVTSRSSYLFKINDEKLIKKTFVNTLNIVCFFTISISFGLIAISDVFVPLFFGDGYTLTIKMINVMAPLVFIICFSNICGGLYYTPSGKRGQSSIYLIIGSVINLILNIILINIIGPIGACISTLIAEFIISFLYIAYCKIITWEQIFIVIWKKIVAGTVMLVFIYFVGKNIFSNPYFDLVFRILSGAFVYMLTLLLLKDKILIDMFRKVKR